MAPPRINTAPRLHTESGERIKAARLQLRDEKGNPLSTEKLAARCGVSANHLACICRGEFSPKEETLALIGDALGLCAKWLRTGKGRKRLRDGESNVAARAA